MQIFLFRTYNFRIRAWPGLLPERHTLPPSQMPLHTAPPPPLPRRHKSREIAEYCERDCRQ
jgi:hypothetical protein